tara:strand:+ start:148 stop:789 length:642 start_codon:yes stop_codon:yes gene_type:complete
MGIYRGPKIVNDGLVLALDAGSIRSYPGTGTTWYDLSGNGNNGTLSASTIGTTTSGTMTFNGTNTSISIPSPNLTSSNFTVMGVAKRNTTASGRLISGGANNWLLGHWGVSSNASFQEGWITPSTDYNDLNTHIYVVTGDIAGDVYTFYNNNVDNTSNSVGGSAGPNGFLLGKYFAGSEYGTGEIVSLYAYNRVLSVSEITQNFNSQKYRFGL